MQNEKWWNNTVVYQIYPRSFQDSNGDGIGDIQGIIHRLDYLNELGVGAIWLSPVYKSPNDDNGYDISDYESIAREFGTIQDMRDLIAEAKKVGIGIVMDLVVNHTSDEHPWFIESKQSRNNKYRDYYVWRDPVNGHEPNGLMSTFGGSAWQFDTTTNQYYLHLFSRKQPDLNWANEKLRRSIYKMMNFWIREGIAGFRMDVIDLIGKDPDKGITENGPKLHEYLHEMNRATFQDSDFLTVGETWGATPQTAKLYSNPKRQELSMVFQFEHIELDQQPGKEKWDLAPLHVSELKQVLSKWQTSLNGEGWNSLFWNNHDLPRIVSRWGDEGCWHDKSAEMFAIILHMMKGTPFIYQGEEIGMTNYHVSNIHEVQDIESINMYHERIKLGYTEEQILASINARGRDNARTPMQWDDSDNAGFTTGNPWIHVNPNCQTINVAQNLADPNSIFATYKKLILLRKTNPIMVWGKYSLIDNSPENVFAFTRELKGLTWLIVANMSRQPQVFYIPSSVGEIKISNYSDTNIQNHTAHLRPYETFATVLSR